MTLFLAGLVVGALIATVVGAEPPDDRDCVYCWDDDLEESYGHEIGH